MKVQTAVEYTDCIFTEFEDTRNQCPGYDTKQSVDNASVLL